MYCKQMKNMPNFATEWQMYMVCPDCEWYRDGDCVDPRKKNAEDLCEFEITGQKLELKIVPVPNHVPL